MTSSKLSTGYNRNVALLTVISALVLLSSSNLFAMSMCCGGTGPEKPVDNEVKAIVEQIRPQVESKIGSKSEFTPVSYRSQVVAGINYFVKIHTGNGKYVHVRIYQDLRNNIKLHGLKSDLGENDGLEYFEANPEYFDD